MVKSKKSAHQIKQDIRVKNNILLPILCAAIPIIVFIVAFLITTPNMKEDNDAINILGVVAQIVASIVCCVISVLGIAFSLQSNEYFGIKLNKLYAMRRDGHITFTPCIIVSFVLLLISVAFYLLNVVFICIGCCLSVVLFDIAILCIEVPYLRMDETTLINILKGKFINDYRLPHNNYNSDYRHDDFIIAIETLIKEKNLQEVYGLFSDDYDNEYNEFVLLKLLDVQEKLARELKLMTDKRAVQEISDNIRITIANVLTGKFNIVNILGEQYNSYQHYVSAPLYLLATDSEAGGKTQELIADLICYGYGDHFENDTMKDFYCSTIISVVACTIKENDFSVLSAIRRGYSSFYLGVEKKRFSSTIFAILSMFLFYLAKAEPYCPSNLKENICNFIEDHETENNTRIISWKTLFKNFSRSFPIQFDEFLHIFSINRLHLEYIIYGEAHVIIFDEDFVTNWFLVVYLNQSFRVNNIEFYNDLEAIHNGHRSFIIDRFVDENFNDRTFSPSEYTKNILDFYGIKGGNAFRIFNIIEENSHPFMEFNDRLHKATFEEEARNQALVNNQEIVGRLLPQINNKIVNEWGYDQSIDISSEKIYYLTIRADKDFRNVQLDSYFVEEIANMIFYNISSSISARMIKLGSTTKREDLKEFLDGSMVDFITSEVKWQYSYLEEPSLREEYNKKINSINSDHIIESHILPFATVILKDGFSFACSIESFQAFDLSNEELSAEVEKYKRADGQYDYEGTFLTREEVARYIRNKYVTLKLAFRFKTRTYPNSVIVFDTDL